MKNIVLFVAFILFALGMNAQNAELVTKFQKDEIEQIQEAITFEKPSLFLNKNQMAKMERVVFKKSNELVMLRNKPLKKAEYVVKHNEVDAKYEPMIEAILTSEQIVMYRKWKSQSKRSAARKTNK